MKKILFNLALLFTLSLILFSCNKRDCYFDTNQNNNFTNYTVNYTASVYLGNVYVPSGYHLLGAYSIVSNNVVNSVQIQSVFLYGGSCNLLYSTDNLNWNQAFVNGNSFTINYPYSNQIYFAKGIGSSGYIYISRVNNYLVNQVNAGF